MIRGLGFLLLVGVAWAQSGADMIFRKSGMFDARDKKYKVDVTFIGTDRTLRVTRGKKAVITTIPFDTIDRLAYGYSKRHRVKEGLEVLGTPCLPGVQLCPAGGIFGGILMLTKSKSHWFYVDYTDARGAKELVLRLDKSEFKAILATAKGQIGRDVETLPEEEN